MTADWVINAALITVNAITIRIAYACGQQNAVNRLIDSRDADAWQYAHFVRADMKPNKKPEDRKL